MYQHYSHWQVWNFNCEEVVSFIESSYWGSWWTIILPHWRTVITVQNNPRVTQDDPRVTLDDPRVTQNDPRVTQDDPRVTQDDPRVTQDDLRGTQDDPSVTQDDPLADWLTNWISDTRGWAVDLWSCLNLGRRNGSDPLCILSLGRGFGIFLGQ